MVTTPFNEIKRLASEQGVEKSLDYLEHYFRRSKEYFKLFEVLKMRCRQRIGLPLMYTEQPDQLDAGQQKQLEDGLLDACREIGTLLFRNGQVQEGWMYLQPVGDKALSEKLIREIKVTEDNIDTIIEISVSQGAAPNYGYELLLQQYGTCNGITTFDTQVGRFDRPTQKAMARTVLHHLYKELVANVRYAVEQTGVATQGDPALGELLASHPGLMAEGAHHIDTTHLASVMRIARLVELPDDLQMAAELAEYGRQLADDFQYPGSPPFEDTYVDHGHYFRALTGQDVETAIEHFRRKMTSVSVDEYGPVAIENLIELLVRLGRDDEALDVSMQELVGKLEPMGIAPSPFEIAKTAHQRQRLMDFYEAENDLLGFSVSLLNDHDHEV